MNPSGDPALVLVGNSKIWHVGHHLREAAENLALPLHFWDSDLAFGNNPLLSKFNWWMRSHRPAYLARFSKRVAASCMQPNVRYLLTTGLAPVDTEALLSIGRAGVLRMNFLTDDPWNPQHSARWFMRALPHYDIVFTPRRANVEDLRRAGCANVHYLPFAYAPAIHFPDPPSTPDEERRYSADIFFAGGADDDRVPYLKALIQAEFKVALYGAYWGRYPETRGSDRGSVDSGVLRKAAGGAKIALCLVRRANRDGHAMRTFELAASGVCILAEDTQEHREILGPEGISAIYFNSIPEMIEKTRHLLANDSLRHSIAQAVRARIHNGGNMYQDRLTEILSAAGASFAVRRADGVGMSAPVS